MTGVAARDVLEFWFAAGPDKWFAKDEAFDAEIAERFGAAVEDARAGRLDGWMDDAHGALALVILIDQFPRNLFRGSAEAFAADAKAREVAAYAIDRRFDTETPVGARQFFYMPFMHSEDLADQERCIRLIESRLPGDEETLRFAQIHRDLIARFGRFPHRNAVLGRKTSPEEETYLSSDGAFTG